MALAGYVFDAYGTLFDVHSAVSKQADMAGDEAISLSQLWRNKQLEYSWIRSQIGSYTDFWSITEDALDFALASHGIDNPKLRDALLEAYWTLDCYVDVSDTLKRLRKSEARIAILTNGSPDMIHAAIESSGIGKLIDDIFCVDAVKSFKPSSQVYAMVTDSWDVKPKKVAFVSSNRWDIAGAAKFGFQCTWINRSNQPDEYLRYAPSKTVTSLQEL